MYKGRTRFEPFPEQNAYFKDSNRIKIGVVTSITRTHVVLWRSYIHILPPKQLKNKTFFTADVEALLYAPA